MVEYICDRCKQIFNKKYNYEHHLSKKIRCAFDKYKDKKQQLKKYECDSCAKTFNRIDLYKKHVSKCCIIIGTNNDNNINNNNIGNKNVINNHIGDNNITLLVVYPFGTPCGDSLTALEKHNILTSKGNIVAACLEASNFDKDKPEYHNVYVSNLRSNKGHTFDGKKWTTEEKSIMMTKLFESKEHDARIFFEELRRYFTKKQVQEIQKKIAEMNPLDYDERKRLTSYIFGVLYNNRKIAIKTKNKLDGQQQDEQLDESDENFILESGISIKDVEKDLQRQRINRVKLLDYITHLLDLLSRQDKIDEQFIKKINERIKIPNTNSLKAIARILTKSAYFNEQITLKMVEKKIDRENEISEFV